MPEEAFTRMSRGMRGATRVTMGETGNEVVMKAPMPVIVVK